MAVCPLRTYATEEMSATGRVNNDTLNVRSGPGTSNEVLGQLHNGDTVDITGSEDGWYRIEYDEEVGYVAEKYVDVIEAEEDSVQGDESLQEEEEVQTDGDAEDDNLLSFGDDLKMTLVIAGVALLLLIMIFATVKSIKNLSDDEEYDDEFDDDRYEEDEYEEDYEEEYEGEADGYDEDDYEEDIEEEPEYREPVSRKKTKPQNVEPKRTESKRAENKKPEPGNTGLYSADPIRYMSNNPDDYRIDIDPSYFEKTGTLPSLDDIVEDIDDADAPSPIKAPTDKPDTADRTDRPDKQAEIEAALKKMDELKAEIERIKNE